MIDTSKSLDALLSYVDHLLDRLDVSGRVPGSLLGRVGPSEVPSGIALALSFGPLRSMIDEMRLVRNEKYPLLLKFVWRMSIANGVEGTPPEWIPSRINFGTYMPSDTQAIVSQIVNLLEKKAIGRPTAIRLLMDAGLDIEDAQAEVDSVAQTDFEGAKDLADATGSEPAAAEYLQIKLPESPPPPPPVGAPPIPPPIPEEEV